jgi:hypothetical protein
MVKDSKICLEKAFVIFLSRFRRKWVFEFEENIFSSGW